MKEKSLKFLGASLAASLMFTATAVPATGAQAENLKENFADTVPDKIKDAGGDSSMGAGIQLNTESGNRKSGKALTLFSTPAGPLGVDVSNHQRDINWVNVAAENVEFAFIKASESNYYSDPYFEKNYQDSGDANLVRGAYHFANPAGHIYTESPKGTVNNELIKDGVGKIDVTSSATNEANHFVEAMNGSGINFYDQKTLPPVLDIEESPYDSHIPATKDFPAGKCYFHTPEQLQQWVTVFLNSVENSTGIRPIIYSAKSFWESCLNNYNGFSANTQLWIASWDLSNLQESNMFGGWTVANHKYWQFTSAGNVNGITGSTDLNVFNGTSEQLKAQAQRATPPPAQPKFLSTELAPATVGQQHSQTIAVENATNISIATETPLPAGLTLQNKTIVGTPSVAGVSNITLIATSGTVETRQSFTLEVLETPVAKYPIFAEELSQPFTMKIGEKIFIPINIENADFVELKTDSFLPAGLQLFTEDINNVHISGILEDYNISSSALVAKNNTTGFSAETEIFFEFPKFETISLNTNIVEKSLANTGTSTFTMLATTTLILGLGTLIIYLSRRNKKTA